MGGHSGAPVTLNKVRSMFFWPGMRKDILQFVQSCSVCLQAKADRASYPGLLEPLPVPDSAWEIISMDFIEGLPMSDHANAILVVVDRYTKFAHFVLAPLLTPALDFHCTSKGLLSRRAQESADSKMKPKTRSGRRAQECANPQIPINASSARRGSMAKLS